MISANPGGGDSCQPLPSTCGDSSCWVGTSDGLVAQVMAVCFEYPMPQATVNVPLVQALQFWLWLLSLWLPWSGCSSSVGLDGVIIHQLDGRLSPITSMSMKVAKASMAWCSSHAPSTNWWGLPRHGGWAFPPSTAGPWHRPGSSLDAAIYNLSWPSKCMSLIGRNWFQPRAWWWACRVIIGGTLGMTPPLRYFRWGPDHPGKLFSHLFLQGPWTAPATRLGCWPGCDPLRAVIEGGFGCWFPLKTISPFLLQVGVSLLKRSPPAVGQGRGTPMVPLHQMAPVGHVLCGQGWWQKLLHCCVPLWARFCKGAILAGWDWVNVCAFLQSPHCRTLLRDLHLAASQLDLLQLPKHLWLPKHWWLPDHPQETEWLSHLMFSSSRDAAANTHWWASLPMARASSQESHHMFLKWS